MLKMKWEISIAQMRGSVKELGRECRKESVLVAE